MTKQKVPPTLKTTEFATAITAFADLSEKERSDQLQKFANIFNAGKVETLSARLKRMSAAQGHPADLKSSLLTIISGLKIVGAKKKVIDSFEVALEIFSGPIHLSIDEFLVQIKEEEKAAPAPKAKKTAPIVQPDHVLARKLADELTHTILNTEAFKKVINQLKQPKTVNTPTLCLIANYFLGNQMIYKSRKPAIDAIEKRQKADARDHALGQAMNRIGV